MGGSPCVESAPYLADDGGEVLVVSQEIGRVGADVGFLRDQHAQRIGECLVAQQQRADDAITSQAEADDVGTVLIPCGVVAGRES